MNVEIDLIIAPGETAGEGLRKWLEVETVASELGITGRVVQEVGPGGGNPVVELTGERSDLRLLLMRWADGDREMVDAMMAGE